MLFFPFCWLLYPPLLLGLSVEGGGRGGCFRAPVLMQFVATTHSHFSLGLTRLQAGRQRNRKHGSYSFASNHLKTAKRHRTTWCVAGRTPKNLKCTMSGENTPIKCAKHETANSNETLSLAVLTSTSQVVFHPAFTSFLAWSHK